MTRLPRQADVQIQQRVAALRTAVNDLRQQQSFGASDVRMYRLYNPQSNMDITLYNLTTTTPQCIEVTVTPNTPVKNPVIVFGVGFQFTSSTGTGSVSYRCDPQEPDNTGVQKFRLYLMAIGSTFGDLSVGFSFWTISQGIYTCAKVTP